MLFIASFLFTFQVCTTRFNNKNKVFGPLSVWWKMRWTRSFLINGQRAKNPSPWQGLEQTMHFILAHLPSVGGGLNTL